MTSEQQQDPQTQTQAPDRLAAISQRVARIESYTAWMLTLMVLAMIVGLIVGIVIAVNVSDIANPSPF